MAVLVFGDAVFVTGGRKRHKNRSSLCPSQQFRKKSQKDKSEE